MTKSQIYSKCQSCAMSIKKKENKGTETNRILSNKYCKFCYKKGVFIEPDIKLAEMQEKCIEFFKLEHPIIAVFFAKKYAKTIAKLERWNIKNS
ncbi:MAG: zinc ribbon domain-containing protein [Spiroplasma sp.]